MAGAAGGCSIVTRFPGIGGRIPLPVITGSIVDMAMLGVVVDFNIGMVWAKVARSTGLGLARLRNAECVAAMARGAATRRAIWIYISHAVVGPRFWGWPVVGV